MTKVILLIITIFFADPAKEPVVKVLPMKTESECRFYGHAAQRELMQVPQLNAVAVSCVVHQSVTRD